MKSLLNRDLEHSYEFITAIQRYYGDPLQEGVEESLWSGPLC
jgi:hypothetical protein